MTNVLRNMYNYFINNVALTQKDYTMSIRLILASKENFE